MEIIAVEHKFSEDQRFENYLGKLAEAVSYKPDVIVGPDYALCSHLSDGTIDFAARRDIMRSLEEISSQTPGTLIIPGTTPIVLPKRKMRHSALLFRDGRNIAEFTKETNVENSGIAEKHGLVYQRGDSSQNQIVHNGKKITVEICSDHGKQRVDKDTFLELILAYDKKAGFYTNAANDDFARNVIVCDSYKPKTEGFRYNPESRDQKLSFLEEQKLNKFLTLFKV